MSHGQFLFFPLALAYFQAGYWLAKLSWKVWHEAPDDGLLAYLLFPGSATMSVFGPDAHEPPALISRFQDRRSYELWMALLWPLKVTWNGLALAALVTARAVMAICLGATATLKLLVYGPERFVRWIGSAAARRRVRSLGSTGGNLPVAVPREASDTALGGDRGRD